MCNRHGMRSAVDYCYKEFHLDPLIAPWSSTIRNVEGLIQKRRKLKKAIINFCCRFGEEHFKKKLSRSLSTQTMVQKEKARTSHTNTSINSKINCLMWWLPCWWSNLQEWNFKDKPYESMNLEIQCTYLHFDLFPRFYCYLTFYK